MRDFPQISGIYQLTMPQRVTLAIPAGYAETTVPLVIALHWGGPVTPFYSKPFLQEMVEPGLRQLGAIIAAPDCQHGGWNNAASEQDVLTLLKTLQANYRIDPDRVILTGYSMGGIGTWSLAAKEQQLFAAAIPMAAPPLPNQVDWQIPLYVIHGRNDELFPIKQTADFVKALQSVGHDITFSVVEGASHYHTARFIAPLKTAVSWLKTRGIF